MIQGFGAYILFWLRLCLCIISDHLFVSLGLLEILQQKTYPNQIRNVKRPSFSMVVAYTVGSVNAGWVNIIQFYCLVTGDGDDEVDVFESLFSRSFIHFRFCFCCALNWRRGEWERYLYCDDNTRRKHIQLQLHQTKA